MAVLILSEYKDEIIFMLDSGVQFKVSPIDKMFVLSSDWHIAKGKGTTKYIRAGRKYRGEYLHILIAREAGLRIVDEVDHKDRNSMNYRRDNLRLATRSQNSMNLSTRRDNKSGSTGIRQRESGRWQARGKINSKLICLGTYDTAEEASEIYESWAKRTFGEFYRGSRK